MDGEPMAENPKQMSSEISNSNFIVPQMPQQVNEEEAELEQLPHVQQSQVAQEESSGDLEAELPAQFACKYLKPLHINH